jgi:alkanesulfonate monooxygenase SsuD/methylene tetrahydromethanopterin reductase-like flavin-dependent oxidoreductase (luciferase family)
MDADRRREPRITLGAAVLPEPERTWLQAVEQLPVDSVWQGGHLLPPSASGEAITRLALMTAWTERVDVGTAVLLLPLYQPVVVAKQLADLDAHAGGRLRVGVGVGGEFPKEFEAVGVPLRERGARTDESIEVMRLLWSGGPVSYRGRFFQFDDVELRAVRPPAPVDSGAGSQSTSPGQPGGPPIIVSGRRPPAMRRAARLGDGWMPYLFSPEAYARSVQAIRDEAQALGRDLDRFEWMLYLYTSIRNDGEQARADVATFLQGAYGHLEPEKLQRIAPAGTPEEVARRVQEYVDAGVRHVVISPAAPSDTLEVVRLAAEEVLPRLTLPVPAR